MEFLLNAEQMKRLDEGTIRQIGIPSAVLMERAALSVVEEMNRCGCDLRSVLVVCGSGNNGGDGLAVARLLDEQGVNVSVDFIGRAESMTEETALQKKICEKCGIKIRRNYALREYTVIVDAIFGIGLSRPVEGEYASVVEWINRQDAYVVSVDIPSGVCADDGRILGCAVRADLTVTFAYRKLGQVLYPGTECCGQVICRDIGITADRFSEGIPTVFTYGEEDLQRIVHRRAYSNKGTYGRVLLIAGSRGMSGAAYLAALAAYRCGSGLVRVFTPECNREVLQAYLPEAIITAYDEVCFSEKTLTDALAWSDVAGIGPGLGTGEVAAALLSQVLSCYRKPLVIDADGLNLLARDISERSFRSPVIVTPHIGEMLRLAGGTKEELLADLPGAARSFATQHGVICALKDARTVVSDGAQTYVNCSGNNGMAAAGSGDILTGVICGLLAQGMQPFEAATLGVYLHGLAGDLAQERLGAYGMIARDIAASVGEVLKRVDSQ